MAGGQKSLTVREWLEQNMEKYTDYDACFKACMKKTKRDPSTIRKYMKNMWEFEEEVEELPSGEDIIDKKDFLGSIDIVAKVLEYLDTVVRDAYIENDKLRRKFGINTTKWRDILRLPVMDGRSLSYNDREGRKITVWSSKKGINAAKETISMARYDK